MIREFFNLEKIIYQSKLKPVDFRNNLENYFQPSISDKNNFLPGEFVSREKFKASSFWTIPMNIRSFEKDPAYLTGVITEDSGLTSITVSYRPNTIFILFFIMFPLFGLIQIILNWNKSSNIENIGSVWFIVGGILIYIWGRYLRISLKKRFERIIQLINN